MSHRRLGAGALAIFAVMALAGGSPAPAQQAPAGGGSSPIQVSGVPQYRFLSDMYPPVAGGANLNALTPVPGLPSVHDGILETAITWTLGPGVSFFADLTIENTTGADFTPSDIEETYLEIHNLSGLPGFRLRLGRDRVKLGFLGLLLDENVFDGGRRDGIDARLAQLGPVSLLGFMQYSLDDGLQIGNWSSSRRVWGGSAEAQVAPGWTVALGFRADTANAAETGPCPGQGCNLGTGWSAGVDAAVAKGVDLVAEIATYTRSGDATRWYVKPTLAFDLQQLLGLPGSPLLTVWAKNFDPYAAPLDAPLGGLLIPSDFAAFNTNDNLTATGARLDLALTPVMGIFLVAEWGTYKNGGPNYTVYSLGAKYSLTTDTVIKISYNSYLVDDGVVTTSAVSGLQLSNAQIFEVEMTKSF